MTSMPVVYRLQQGLRALFAFSQDVDWALVERYLSPTLLDLFRQMDRGEQLHSIAVLRDVLAQGDTPTDLAVVALLHDVGKSRYPISVWQKTFAVIVRSFAPSLYERWSKGSPLNLWQRPFVVYEQHPLWSAELLRTAGASELACWLAAHHADRNGIAPMTISLALSLETASSLPLYHEMERGLGGEDLQVQSEWLKRLQQADDQN